MTPLRQTMIHLLRAHNFSVDIFGSQTRPVRHKSETMKNYKYALCFENSYHPGYITEKIFDAFSAGTIPLYWGSELPPPINESSLMRFPCDALDESVKSITRNSLPYSVDILEEDKFTVFENKIHQFLMKLLFDLYM